MLVGAEAQADVGRVDLDVLDERVLLGIAGLERRRGLARGEVLVCDAIGIPCVNGVRDAAEVLQTGDRVTVDGFLGIVTVGAPELDLELRPPR